MNVKAAQFWYGVASPFYDGVRNLIYPSAKGLTFDLIEHLPSHSSALCIGGGTGEWLPTYIQLHSDSTLYYVDISNDMIRKAKSRVESNSINFIQANAKSIHLPKKIDLVILPFFLDHFHEGEIATWLDHLQTLGNNQLQVAIVDFNPNSNLSYKTRFLVWFACLFLKLKIESLPQIDVVLRQKGFLINWKAESQTCFAALYSRQ